MNFKLRPIQRSDADDLAHFANNKKIADNLTDAFPHPYTLDDAHKFIDMAFGFDPPRILVIEIEGRATGAAGIHPMTDVYRTNAELGYWLAEPYWGKGIMSRVVPEMVDYGFQTFDIDRIFARPFGRNVSSQKVLEKAGFILEARFERTILKNGIKEDELVYAVRRATWKLP